MRSRSALFALQVHRPAAVLFQLQLASDSGSMFTVCDRLSMLNDSITQINDALEIMELQKIDFVRLGENIRFLRQGRGWSLSDLAEKSHLSKAYISDIENGAAGKPNVQYLFQIAEALDTTIDGLLREAKIGPAAKVPRRKEDLPTGLSELQEELNLTDDDMERLSAINFRGDRPRDKEGWRFLLQTLQLLGQRKHRR